MVKGGYGNGCRYGGKVGEGGVRGGYVCGYVDRRNSDVVLLVLVCVSFICRLCLLSLQYNIAPMRLVPVLNFDMNDLHPMIDGTVAVPRIIQCLAYRGLGFLVFISRIYSLSLSLKLRPVCPMYIS
jgi:hypothetical protein